jgi:hypothetical protein
MLQTLRRTLILLGFTILVWPNGVLVGWATPLFETRTQQRSGAVASYPNWAQMGNPVDEWASRARWAEDYTDRAAVDEFGWCAVHHQPLHPMLVPIRYGYLISDINILKAEWRNAPNAWQEVNGGCLGDKEEEAIVLHCYGCRRAKARMTMRR